MLKIPTIILLFTLTSQKILIPNTPSGRMSEKDIQTVNKILNKILPNYTILNNLQFIKGTVLKDLSIKGSKTSFIRNYTFSMKNGETICNFDLGVCGENFIFGPENEKFKKQMQYCSLLIKENLKFEENLNGNGNDLRVNRQKDFIIKKKRKINRPIVFKKENLEEKFVEKKIESLESDESFEEFGVLDFKKSLSFEKLDKKNKTFSTEIKKLDLIIKDQEKKISSEEELNLNLVGKSLSFEKIEKKYKTFSAEVTKLDLASEDQQEKKISSEFSEEELNLAKKSLSFEKPQNQNKTFSLETPKLNLNPSEEIEILTNPSEKSEEKISENDLKKELDLIVGQKSKCDEKNKKAIKSYITKLQMKNKFQFVILYDENILECSIKLVQGIVYEVVLGFNDEKCDLSIWSTLDGELKILDRDVLRESRDFARGSGVEGNGKCLERFGTEELGEGLGELKK